MNKKLIARIKELFEAKLSSKTGWGRNEVIQLHNEAINEAILEQLDGESS